MIVKFETKIQDFDYPCNNCKKKYNLSHSKFVLFREDFKFNFNLINLTFYSRSKIYCQNCSIKYYIPYYISKKFFKYNKKVSNLFKLINIKWINNEFVSLYMSLWWVFGITVLINLFFLFYKYQTSNILLGEVQEVDLNDFRNNNFLNKIVKVKVKADLSQTFLLEVMQVENNKASSITKEVYFPFFFNNQNDYFAVYRGNENFANKIKTIIQEEMGNESQQTITSKEIELIGRIIPITGIQNQELYSFFVNTYSNEKVLPKPQVLLDGKTKTIQEFIIDNLIITLIPNVLFFLSLYLNLYLDRILSNNNRN